MMFPIRKAAFSALMPALLLLAHAACFAGPVEAFPNGAPTGAAPSPAPHVPGRPAGAIPTPAPETAPSLEVPPAFPESEQGGDTGQDGSPDTGRLPALLSDSADPSARARALEAFPLSANAEQEIGRCVAGLLDASPEIRDAAAKCAADTPPAHLFAYMIRTMAWGDPEAVRTLDAALPRLAGLADALLLETLGTELETARHKRAAAYCLGRMGVTAAAEPLARLAWAPDPQLADTAARALAMLRWPGAYNALAALLEHPETSARLAALRGLAEINTPPGRRTVADTAAGSTGQAARVRMEAVRLLGMQPAVDAVPTLIDIMRADKAMAQPAARVLKEITGLNYGPDPEAWARELLLEPPPSAPPQAGGMPWEATETGTSGTSETSTRPSSGPKTPKGRVK